MLGIIANPSDECIVREFFELFKTPWEFHRPGSHYDVILCSGDVVSEELSAGLLLVYSSAPVRMDSQYAFEICSKVRGGRISFAGLTIPIYGDLLEFGGEGAALTFARTRGGTAYVRVGYDLFSEIRKLLVEGQPASNATSPTFDLHIALLRHLIVSNELPLVEIPPAPAGYPFIVCLTHDIDHASIRRHRLDRTMLGFLYRATIASAVSAARGRLPLKKLVTNWVAAAKLPMVYLGLAEDFWLRFDRYLDLERGRPSTFFAIPRAGSAGNRGQFVNGAAPAARRAAYDVSHISKQLRALKVAGCEIAVHGIDAWTDSAKGREEAKRISDASDDRATGVRMHWLYFDEASPAVLEDAGFSYDSTLGYNERIGYRAGTGQAFTPIGAKELRELPLHVMDTAMFYPDYLNLTDDQAWSMLRPFIENAIRYGGVLTLNWHDRSIAPERLWGDFYERLLGELTARGALFLTASETVSWFRKRRSVVFERQPVGHRFHAKASNSDPDKSPALRLRFHRPQDHSRNGVEKERSKERFMDIVFHSTAAIDEVADERKISASTRPR